MENLTNKLGRMGLLFLIGILVIIYAALGIIYVQQGPKQRELELQINKLSLTLLKPLPSAEKLQAEYDEAQRSMSPLTPKEALDIIVGVAAESGIDVDPDRDKFLIPQGNLVGEKRVGEGNYQVLSFKNVKAQGDYDSVMAFLSNLESGEGLKTAVLNDVAISQIELQISAEEESRMAEYHDVQSAVIAMMTDNVITKIPNPATYASGIAQNQMGFVAGMPDQGFPDFTTTAADKGYTGAGSPNPGYVLYQHDKIDPSDTTTYSTLTYLSTAETKYYYTCETDGTVRQFGGPDVATAKEYRIYEVAKTETVAALTVDIYTKPGGERP